MLFKILTILVILMKKKYIVNLKINFKLHIIEKGNLNIIIILWK